MAGTRKPPQAIFVSDDNPLPDKLKKSEPEESLLVKAAKAQIEAAQNQLNVAARMAQTLVAFVKDGGVVRYESGSILLSMAGASNYVTDYTVAGPIEEAEVMLRMTQAMNSLSATTGQHSGIQFNQQQAQQYAQQYLSPVVVSAEAMKDLRDKWAASYSSEQFKNMVLQESTVQEILPLQKKGSVDMEFGIDISGFHTDWSAPKDASIIDDLHKAVEIVNQSNAGYLPPDRFSHRGRGRKGNRKKMTRFSVFTPSHNPKWLNDCYESLLNQTFEDWEWVVLLNGGTRWNNQQAKADPRVKIATIARKTGVGMAKSLCVEACTGEILVELDHDDILADDCLYSLDEAFIKNPEAGMIYSDTAQMNEDRSRNDDIFMASNGWRFDECTVSIAGNRESYLQCHSMVATPHNVSCIWFAPNHVRAFTKSAYDQTNGYNENLVVLDDQDLMMQLYKVGEFVRIPKVLYLQRIHGKNTQSKPELNAKIQVGTWEQYEAGIQDMALTWAKRHKLRAIDLGCGNTTPAGYEGLDFIDGPKVDIVAQAPDFSMIKDNSVGVLRAVDFIEHVADKIALMEEIYRILAPGGMLFSLTPSTEGNGAHQDPTHVSFWNENSFWYWTDDKYKFVSPQINQEVKAKFQVSQLRTFWIPNRIAYVQANLIAIKDSSQPRNGGQLLVH